MSGAFGYYLYRALSAVFSRLPEPVIRRLGSGLGWLLSHVATERRAMAERHQRRIGVADPAAASRRVFASYGRYWAETFWVTPRRHRWLLDNATIEGLHHLREVQATGRGIVLALPHLGNWEAAGLRAAVEGARVLAVAEALPNERIVDWFIDQRAQLDIDVLIARKGSQVTRRLLERLKEGGTIALLSDRDVTGRGIEAEFFGETTTLPAGPISLAVRTDSVVLPVGTYFADGAGHRFVVHPPLPIPEGDSVEQRVAAGTQLLATKLEEIIRVAPEQWHLIVPNWPSDRV